MNIKIKPTTIDVLFGGRGKPFTDHLGNVKFRDTVDSFYEAYKNGRTANDRKEIVKQVKMILEDAGVLFLKMVNKQEEGAKKSSILDADYQIADESAILAKIQQRFANQKSQENKTNKRAPLSPTRATSENQFEVCLGVIFKEALEWAQQNPNAHHQQLARDFANCDHKKETSALHKAVNAIMMIQLQGCSGRASPLASEQINCEPRPPCSRHFQPEAVFEPPSQLPPLEVPSMVAISPTSRRVSDLSTTTTSTAPPSDNHSVSDQLCTYSVEDFLKDVGLSSSSLGSLNGSRCSSVSYDSSMFMP